MCCFSRHVESVSGTEIFARGAAEGRQFLVYAMTLTSKEDLAMILPLPVPPDAPEDALRFINLKDYPDFFKDLHRGFPAPASEPPPGLKSDPKPRGLAVVDVGDFEASFVPSVKDFDRLDERFRLPATPPAVKGFGFAVFKLKKGVTTVHPMAFEFPRANPAKLFFPTLHIHDGKAHAAAAFDHTLFAQNREGEQLAIHEWWESDKPASLFMKTAKAQGLVDGERHVYMLSIAGNRKNEDILV